MIGSAVARNQINRQINEINRQINNANILIERLNNLIRPLNQAPDHLQIAANGLNEHFTINEAPGDEEALIRAREAIDGMATRIRSQSIPEIRNHINQLVSERERLNAELLAL